jgi:hypothetical protein
VLRPPASLPRRRRGSPAISLPPPPPNSPHHHSCIPLSSVTPPGVLHHRLLELWPPRRRPNLPSSVHPQPCRAPLPRELRFISPAVLVPHRPLACRRACPARDGIDDLDSPAVNRVRRAGEVGQGAGGYGVWRATYAQIGESNRQHCLRRRLAEPPASRARGRSPFFVLGCL